MVKGWSREWTCAAKGIVALLLFKCSALLYLYLRRAALKSTNSGVEWLGIESITALDSYSDVEIVNYFAEKEEPFDSH